jgi:acyl-CoA-binding protein
MVSKRFLGGLGVKERAQPALFTPEKHAPLDDAITNQQAVGAKKANQPTLIDLLERKKAEATSNLTAEERTIALDRYANLRSWICKGKSMLFGDDAVYSESWDANYAKFARWMNEYETLVRRLAENGIEPMEARCQSCWSLILVAWETNAECEYCTATPARKSLYRQIKTKGFAPMKCPTLGGEVINLVWDESVDTRASKAVRFTLSELWLMRDLTPDQAAQVWLVKKELGGAVQRA